MAAVGDRPDLDLEEVATAGLMAYFDHVVAHPKEHLLTYELTQYALREEGFEGVAKEQYDYYLRENEALLEAFAEKYSAALQTTLFDMGSRVLERHADIAEIRLSMPNKHHFVVDLGPFGLDNPNEVFFAADRPYGLIEATVQRADAGTADAAWAGIAGFC